MLFRKKISVSSREVVSGPRIVDSLRKHLATDGVCQSPDGIMTQAKETFD